MADRYFLLVEGEPYLAACKAWKESYERSVEAARKFVEALGATGGYSNRDTLALSGVNAVNPLPAGWKRVPGKRGMPDYMIPHEKARDPEQREAGIAARKAMDALPKANDQDDIAQLIGAPRSVHWKSHGKAEGWRSVAVSFFHTIQVTYFGDTFVLLAPDTRRVIAELMAQHEGVVIEGGEWTPPAGLRIITEAEHDLMLAQWKVSLERTKEDASDA